MSTRTSNRAKRRNQAKRLRETTRQNLLEAGRTRRLNRLNATLRRRPRSLATHALAAGVPAQDVTGFVHGLYGPAKKLGIKPVKITRTRRTVGRGRSRIVHTVKRYTWDQVQQINAAYKPRKAEYKAAKSRLALAA